jgi:hypothetical protein
LFYSVLAQSLPEWLHGELPLHHVTMLMFYMKSSQATRNVTRDFSRIAINIITNYIYQLFQTTWHLSGRSLAYA